MGTPLLISPDHCSGENDGLPGTERNAKVSDTCLVKRSSGSRVLGELLFRMGFRWSWRVSEVSIMLLLV